LINFFLLIMKILIVAVTFYPNVNGASYFTQRLARYLHEKGHEVLVIAPSRFLRHENYNLNGVRVFGVRSFPMFLNGFRIAQSFLIKGVIRKKIKEFKPDVIHLQSHLVFSKATIAAARELKIPVVGTNHFMPENLTPYLHLPEFFEKWLIGSAWRYFLKIFSQVDAVTTPTLTGAKLLANIGLKKEVIPISCGIDFKIFNPLNNGDYLKAKYNLPDKPILLYLGRLDKEKNVNELIDAFALVLKKVDAHFLIAGFGAEEENLKKQAERLKIKDAVTFTGFVSDEDKPNFYAVADCFAIACLVELQSIVTMEAMASGLPVAAVDALALPHLVRDGENGCLFPPRDIGRLSDCLTSILSDRNLRVRMSEASLNIIKEHDINNIIIKYEEIYNQVIVG